MLKSKKGVAVGTVIKLILAILIASAFISITTIGPLGDALKDSFDAITGQTDFTAEITNKEQLSQLAMFVRDRSDQCSRVRTRNEGDVPSGYQGRPEEDITPDGKNGYPALAEFGHLEQKPDCVGGEGNKLLRGDSTPQADFMPGVLSRERFEIKKASIKIDKAYSDGDSSSWIDHNFNSISALGPNKMIYNTPYTDRTKGKFFRGTGPNYVVFFENSTVARKRSNIVIQDPPSSAETELTDHTWFNGASPGAPPYSVKASWITNNQRFTVRLCKGDQGYIQRNTAVPHNTGVRSTRGSGVNSGLQDYYPMIVITDTEQKSCGEVYKEIDNSKIHKRLYIQIEGYSDSEDYSPEDFTKFEKISPLNKGNGDIYVKWVSGSGPSSRCVFEPTEEKLLKNLPIDNYRDRGAVRVCRENEFSPDDFSDYLKSGESLQPVGSPIHNKFLRYNDRWYECADGANNVIPDDSNQNPEYVCNSGTWSKNT